MTRYERYVIRPILSAIETHQDFLCKPENLPQLAKLGFMFEKLWYAGRVAYGCEGRVKKGGYTCENNPKYELGDTIKYNSEENENLVYDAWGMHVSNDPNTMNFDEFCGLIQRGRPLSVFEIKERKPNKTFDEWVEIMTSKDYKYHRMFPDRRRVADYLLCTIGTGYGYNKATGMIIKEASGADQDKDMYGAWENAKFTPKIQDVVNKVLAFNMTQIAMDAESAYVLEFKRNEKEKRRKEQHKYHEKLLPILNKALTEKGKPTITIDSPEFDNFLDKYEEAQLNEIMEKHGNKRDAFEYYPICNYSRITHFDENTHPSYIIAGLEICEDMLANPPELKSNFNEFQIKQREEGLEFAKNFINKFKK